MTAAAASDHARIYAQLKTTIVKAGILDRSLSYYAATILLVFAGFVASLISLYVFDDWLILAPACFAFTFFSVQVAGLMHDAGHRAVFSSKRANDVLGYVCCAAIGTIFDSWRWHHNAHHAHPNQHLLDPDMEIPFIATSGELYAGKSGIQGLVARWQVYYFHSLGLIVSISNRLGSFTYFVKRASGRTPWKLAMYLPAIFVLFPLPFLIFPLAKALFVFAVVHATSGLYLANCFAPNHKGMRHVAADAKLSFLEQQVVTARNVRGGFLTNLVLMGLNYQTEHHLFPNCPRNKLIRLQPYVQAACREAGLVYTEVSFIETNRFVLKRLGDATQGVRATAGVALS